AQSVGHGSDRRGARPLRRARQVDPRRGSLQPVRRHPQGELQRVQGEDEGQPRVHEVRRVGEAQHVQRRQGVRRVQRRGPLQQRRLPEVQGHGEDRVQGARLQPGGAQADVRKLRRRVQVPRLPGPRQPHAARRVPLRRLQRHRPHPPAQVRSVQAAQMSPLVLACAFSLVQDGYQVRKDHPRLLVDDVKAVVQRSAGPLSDEYKALRSTADGVRDPRNLATNGWGAPDRLLSCALAACVERAAGRDGRKYVEVILKHWGDGSLISNQKGSQFGFHALAYDWIYEDLTPEQRVTYGDALGSWLSWYTNKAEIQLKYGDWFYNQTWGPSHLNIMHSRDALTQKLF